MKTELIALAAAMFSLSAFADTTYESGINTIDQAQGAITVSGKTELHITAVEEPIDNATINLVDDNSWLFFHAVKPSKVRDNMLQHITINGAAAKYPDNVRLAEYGSGCVVIPHGTASDADALTVYDQPYCQGNAKVCEIYTYHNNLGAWDNKVMSFKLKRGYMATFGNNPDGTGHSRCFIADDDDIVCEVMPDGFVTYNGEGDTFDAANTESFVSFIRVFRWDWPGKKGWAGWTTSEILAANPDSYYTWSADKKGDSAREHFWAMDFEYVPIKQQRWWPGWDQIGGLPLVSHLLGYNEPDHADQANVEFEVTIDEWPNMMKSGLRVGSPAPADPNSSWFTNFFHYINLCNYRCDFAVAHIYKYFDANGWIGDLNGMVKRSGGRPCWITEYNNGANWTHEAWPSGNRAATEENLEHQRQWIEKILPAMDTIPMLERAHFYNWVEDCRALVLNGKLTPAGQVFANHVSVPAYRKADAYDHIWKIAPPYTRCQADKAHENVTISFYDHNGETGKGYKILRLEYGGYVEAATLLRGVDYEAGDHVTWTEPLPQNSVMTIYYQVIGISYKDTESQSTGIIKVTGAPLDRTNLRRVSASGENVVIEWDPVEGATSYRIKRGTSSSTLYNLEYNWEETTYCDDSTSPETVYYYQVGAQSPWSDTVYSNTLRIYSGASGIASAGADELVITAANGSIVIESPIDGELDVYMADGRKARTVRYVAGTTIVNNLAPGLYIANGKKIAL